MIVVFGATGVQGGSVIDAMKDDKRFLLKAATRNLQSDKAKKLAAEGKLEVLTFKNSYSFRNNFLSPLADDVGQYDKF